MPITNSRRLSPNKAIRNQNEKLTTHTIPKRTYQPYQTTTLETPLWHLLLEPICLNRIKPVLAAIYRLRSQLAQPLKTQIFPDMPFLPASVSSTTVGDLVLIVPVLLFLLRGSHYTFVEPSLERSGYMSAYCIFLAYLTATKSNSLFSWLFGIPYDRLIGLHWFASTCGVVLGFFHCYVSYAFGGDDNGDSIYSKAVVGGTPNLGKFLMDGLNNVSGTLLLAAMTVIVCTSYFQFLRRLFFNIWYLLHIILGITILIMLFLHSVPSAAFVTAWWALDLIVRYGIMAGLLNVTRAKLRILGKGEVVELVIKKPKGFSFNAGQFVRVAVPALSALEFHPISISSAPDEPYLVLHIRNLGDWTQQLVQLAETTDFTDVKLEGPYGTMAIDLEDDEKYTMVLCVSGGIGVTPCQSIGKDLLLKHRQRGRRLKQLQFVWVVRDLKLVEGIPPLLLNDGGAEDYSQSNPEYQRMLQRSVRTIATDKSDRSMTTTTTTSDVSKLPRRPAVVQADVYCTRPVLDQDTENNNHHHKQYNLHTSGRPDLDAIFDELKQSAIAMGESNVAVIGCGPPSLMEAVHEACLVHSSSMAHAACSQTQSVFFDFHKEHFEL